MFLRTGRLALAPCRTNIWRVGGTRRYPDRDAPNIPMRVNPRPAGFLVHWARAQEFSVSPIQSLICPCGGPSRS